MHGSIQDRLEAMLANGKLAAGDTNVAAHLASCSECSAELRAMRAQASMLRSLRAPGELEPSAGFYARVMQRIEERAKQSIWAGLIYSPFSKTFAYASLSLALMLGAYIVSQEKNDGDPHLENMISQQAAYSETQVFGNQSQQRDAVLVNFVSYQGSSQ